MKKLFLPLLACVCIQTLNAQQVIDLTTGATNNVLLPVGSNDDTWTVQIPLPPGQPFTNAIVSNGTLSNAGPTLWPNTYAENTCGQWISGNTVTTPGPKFGTIPHNGRFGNHIYRMRFLRPNQCVPTSAVITLNDIGADDDIVSINVNGNVHPVGAVGFSPLTPSLVINLAPSEILTSGINTVEVVVRNEDSFTGLLMCGNLTITDNYAQPHITGNDIFCWGDPLIFDGSTSEGNIATHYWQFTECDDLGTPVSGGASWGQWYSGAPGTINFATAMGFTPKCNKHYRVRLMCDGCDVSVQDTKIIYIQCAPKMPLIPNQTVCQGTSVTLNAGTNAANYVWSPGGYTTSTITVYPSTTTTYTVTGSTNGCSNTTSTTVTVMPANFSHDISTGVNTGGSMISFGAYDDGWRIRGVPGTIYSAPFTSLTKARVVAPYNSVDSPWTSSTSVRWLSSTASAGGIVEVLPTHTDNTPNHDNYYYFEYVFNIPFDYDNLRIEMSEYASDNSSYFLLNSGALTGSTTNIEYSLPYWNDVTNFTTLHNAGTIATNQAHYITGNNTLLVRITNQGGTNPNGNSYMGFLVKAKVKGECYPTRSVVTENEAEKTTEIESETMVYPNPSTGMFTVNSGTQNMVEVMVKDAMGRTIKTIANVNAAQLQLDLQAENKGVYIIQIKLENVSKPVFKKIIIQ